MAVKNMPSKPNRAAIQSIAVNFAQHDEKGEYLSFEQAEKMLDLIFANYSGIFCQYVTRPTGREELVITSASRRTEYLRMRIERD